MQLKSRLGAVNVLNFSNEHFIRRRLSILVITHKLFILSPGRRALGKWFGFASESCDGAALAESGEVPSYFEFGRTSENISALPA